MRIAWPLFCVVAVAGYLSRAALPVPPLSRTTTGVLFLLLAIILAASVNSSRTRLAAFLKGARGEESVARKLAFLPSPFMVFHGVPAMGRGILAEGGRDFDHVVVGPSGLFVIETKNWTGDISIRDGRILCDGEEPSRQPVDQVKAAAARLRGRISKATETDVEVSPIICFAKSSPLGGQQGVMGVVACSSEDLNGVITEGFASPFDEEKRNRISATLLEWMDSEDDA